MMLTERELVVLKALAAACQKLVEDAEQPRGRLGRARAADGGDGRPRVRRTGDELAEFRRLLLEERQRGAAPADLARKYGVSRSYIYNLKP